MEFLVGYNSKTRFFGSNHPNDNFLHETLNFQIFDNIAFICQYMFDTDYIIKVILILYINLNIYFKEIMRANDPSLIHPWHPKFCDSALGHHQLDSCQRTRASHLGSIDWLYEKWRNPRWPRKKIRGQIISRWPRETLGDPEWPHVTSADTKEERWALWATLLLLEELFSNLYFYYYYFKYFSFKNCKTEAKLLCSVI